MKHFTPNKNCHCSDEAPKFLQVKMNNRCNGACWFCIDRNNRKGTEINVDKMVEAILSESDYNIVGVTGGEPLLDFDALVELLRKIRPYKSYIILNTNGSLLTEEKVEILNDLVDEVRIGLHHYDEEKNNQIIHANMKFSNLKNALRKKRFKATFNMVITKLWLGEEDIFVDKMASLCKELNVDAAKISELKYVGENHGFEEYAVGHVKAYNFFKNFIKPKTSQQLIKTGCVDVFNYKGIEFSIKRLCGYKIKSNVQTFKVVYSDGKKTDDWEYSL